MEKNVFRDFPQNKQNENKTKQTKNETNNENKRLIYAC